MWLYIPVLCRVLLVHARESKRSVELIHVSLSVSVSLYVSRVAGLLTANGIRGAAVRGEL